MINGIANIPGIKEVRGGSTLIWQKQAPAPSYEPETTAYFNAITIPNDATVYNVGTPQEQTGTQMWNAVDTSIKYYKAQGVWASIGTFYPMLGLDGTTRGINAKDPALHKLTFYGSWVFSGAGNKGNGANTYADLSYPFAGETGQAGGASIAILDNATGNGMEYSHTSPYLWYIASDFSNNTRHQVRAYNSAGIVAHGGVKNAIYTGYSGSDATILKKNGSTIINRVYDTFAPYNADGIYGAYQNSTYVSPRLQGSLIEYLGANYDVIAEGHRMFEIEVKRITA